MFSGIRRNDYNIKPPFQYCFRGLTAVLDRLGKIVNSSFNPSTKLLLSCQHLTLHQQTRHMEEVFSSDGLSQMGQN